MGLIRVTAPASWGQRVLGPLLPTFLAQHTGMLSLDWHASGHKAADHSKGGMTTRSLP
jgi:DNA-binding transcriptional LysR family regulator